LILGERFHVWPFAQPIDRLTAAQVGVLAEALRPPPDADAKPKTLKMQPKLSRQQLLAIAATNTTETNATT